jgi:hypothetical protein
VAQGSDNEGDGERREVATKGSGDEWNWWRREVMKKEREMLKKSTGEGKGWWREVVTKGSGDEVIGDEEKWRRRDVVSGVDGMWWWRRIVRQRGADDWKWWGREAVRKGSGRREVVSVKELMMRNGEEGKWWIREEAGIWNFVFLVKWRWKVPRFAAVSAGSFLSRIVLLCTWNDWCSSIRFLKLWFVN